MSIRYEEMAILLIQSQAMEKSIDQLKIETEIAKLMAETAKLSKETFWYPLVVSSGIIAAVATIVKVFF